MASEKKIRAGRAYVEDMSRLAKVWRLALAVATGRVAIEIGLRVRRANGQREEDQGR